MVRCKPLISASLLASGSLEIVIVKIGGVDQQRRLFANHIYDARMCMAQGVDTDSGDKVEIPVAVHIVDVAPLAAIQHQRVAGIVLQEKLALQIDDLLRFGSAG